jgi:hypothetical protein
MWIKFFQVVVGPDLRRYILGKRRSLMVLAACGAVVNVPSALEKLREVTQRYAHLPSGFRHLTPFLSFRFSDVIAFSERNLDPHRVVSFVNEFSMNALVTGHPSASALLIALSSSSTSQFTGIVHLETTDTGVVIKRIERLHHTRRPNGQKLPLQCPKCRAYRSWIIPPAPPKELNKPMVFKCCTKYCDGVCEIPHLEGYEPLLKDDAIFYSTTL